MKTMKSIFIVLAVIVTVGLVAFAPRKDAKKETVGTVLTVKQQQYYDHLNAVPNGAEITITSSQGVSMKLVMTDELRTKFKVYQASSGECDDGIISQHNGTWYCCYPWAVGGWCDEMLPPTCANGANDWPYCN